MDEVRKDIWRSVNSQVKILEKHLPRPSERSEKDKMLAAVIAETKRRISDRLRISSARNEATNNKIKLLIRKAYGFRNIGNMIDFIYLVCSDLKIPLPT